jgi:predicted ATPase
MLSAVRSAASGAVRLSVRVGVESGLAVVGPLWPARGASYGAVGKVTEHAAALRSAAKPGSVLVGPATKRSTEHLFDWGPTEEVSTGSEAKPLSAIYLERPKAPRAGPRHERRPGGCARLVGRAAELSVLDGAVRKATSGMGAVIFIVGEPGLGKTRLVQECGKRFMAWVGAATGRLPLWLEGRCASYACSTPYGLYQQLLSAWIGVALEEGEEVVCSALGRAMRAVFGGEVEDVQFLAHMLGIRTGPNGAHVARLSPEALQRATFASVRAVVEHLVARGPTVLALEDLHWADATSLRLTEELAGLADDAPLLVIATRRPEPDPGVSALESALEKRSANTFRRTVLWPLNDGDEQDLARWMLGRDAGEDVVAAERENADGVPLFLEEHFWTLVESGALVKQGQGWAFSRSVTIGVPEPLDRMVRARVDRLPTLAHDVVVAASVLGPEFSLPALSAVTGMTEHLDVAVRELCDARLLSEVRRLPAPVYRFRHALVQDATYRALLVSQRRQFHARAAWGLEAASAGRLDEVAAILGHHFAMAGEIGRALHYFQLAGRHAFAHFAIEEAVSSYRRAIEIADRDGAASQRAQAPVELRYHLSEVLWRSGQFAGARQALNEALALVDPRHRLFTARLRTRLGRVEVEDFRYDAAIGNFDAADELLGSEQEDHDGEWVDAWLELQVDGRANLYKHTRDLERHTAVLARSRPVVETSGSPDHKAGFYVQLASQLARAARYRVDDEALTCARMAVQASRQGVGEHRMAYSRECLSELLFWYGDLNESEQITRDALALGERVDDPKCQRCCLAHFILIGVRRHDVEYVRSRALQTLAVKGGGEDAMLSGVAKAGLAWVSWREGLTEEAMGLAAEALQRWARPASTFHYKGLCLWPVVSVHLVSGRLDRAVEAGRQMLEPTQVRLPDNLEGLLEEASAALERQEAAIAVEKLSEALGLAGELGYA